MTRRALYQPPNRRRGASQIGFGGTADDVAQRVAYINDLYRNGHEIASHAVGHFDGSGWSAADWTQEFSSFRDVLANVAANNGLDSTVKFAFPLSEVIGFRAPYLATSPGLYTALKDDGFRYDTSGDSSPETGRTRSAISGASIWCSSSSPTAAGTRCRWTIISSPRNRTTVVDPARRDAFREEMLQTYLDYFQIELRGQSRAAEHRPSFLRLSGRRLPGSAENLRAHGLRPARGALRHLRGAGRFHGQPGCADARSLPQRRFPACRAVAERGGGRASSWRA